MLTLDVVNQFVYENFSDVTTSKNGYHFLARCALCGDSKKNASKKRFNLDYNNGNPIYNCFNCGESGTFLQLYSTIKGISINEAKDELYEYNPNYLIQILSKRKKEKILKEIESYSHNNILDDCAGINLKVDSILYNSWIEILKDFYKDRKIDKSFPIFYAYKGDYKGRIIIPIYNENEIVYFQARSVPGSNIVPKYKNPTLFKGNIIFNKDNFDKEKYIVITEGLIDANSIGNQGTSCLGSYISDSFLKEIFKLTDKGIIIAFDNDKPGFKGLWKFMNESKYSKRVKYFIMPNNIIYKDMNELIINIDVGDVYEFILNNSYSYEKTYIYLHLNKNKLEKLREVF